MTDNNLKNIPNGWMETNLGDVSLLKQYGYTESASDKKIGPNFLRITDIQEDFINWKTVPYCPISDSDYKKYKLKIGDVVIARTGNSTGATAVIKEDIDAVFASYLIRFKLDPQKVSYKFIDFLLRSDSWKGFVKSIKSGSAQGGANANNFAGFPFTAPPLHEQEAIASVLSSFDDKIELLKEENKTLEEIGQTIFNEWFGKYSINNELPDGWKFFELNKLFTFIKGKKPIETSEIEQDKFIPQILIDTFNGGKTIFANPKNTIISDEDDLIMVMDGASSGRIEFGFSGIIGSTLSLLKIEKPIKSILYFFLKSKEKDIQEKTTGSAIPHTDKNKVYNYQIPIPNNEVEIRKLDIVFSNFREKIIANRFQIQSLARSRDELLPRLMSGEIRVNEYVNAKK